MRRGFPKAEIIHEILFKKKIWSQFCTLIWKCQKDKIKTKKLMARLLHINKHGENKKVCFLISM
jgi:hypothetical protein